MARKKKPPEHANHERWLVSYADFITLLFAFFTTMYAISTADTAKLQKLMHSMQGAFGGAASKATPVMPETGKTPFSPEFQAISVSRPASYNVGRAEQDVFRIVQQRIEKFLVKGISEGAVRIIVSDRGLIISISDSDLFRPGEAEINPKAREMLEEIALSLVDLPNFVRVEGHTDNQPVRSKQFPSNWELSSARASRLVRWFAEKYKFPPDRLCAAGYGEFRPAAGNNTEAGRAANRRLEIVVLRNRLALTEP
ncbi:MAG: OmpA family protein [Deltaproteobacteria bacterium]|nr:OmpA family protein [Deltaproteobacteria bacterium]